MNIHWNPSLTINSLHVASWTLVGQCEGALHSEVRPAVQQLLEAAAVDAEELFQALIIHAFDADADDSAEGDAVAVDPLIQSLPSAWNPQGKLAAALERVFAAVANAVPRLQFELPARVRPLREQWEARAPGFLRALKDHLGLKVETRDSSLRLALVTPLWGGFGKLYGEDQAVIEAVLYHPTPNVPEPVRVGFEMSELLHAVSLAGRAVEWLKGDVGPQELATAWALPS